MPGAVEQVGAALNQVTGSLGLSDQAIGFLGIFISAITALGTALKLVLPPLSRMFFNPSQRLGRSKLAIFLKDADFVGGFDPKVADYLPISTDADIEDAISNDSGVILVGRGGIGKSQAACLHIRKFSLKKWYQFWIVISPDKIELNVPKRNSIIKRNNILLFDDLNLFLQNTDPTRFFSFLEYCRINSRNLRIVCTIRSTDAEFSTMMGFTPLTNRIRHIALEDWSDQQRDILRAKTGIDAGSFDGTPLSVKRPRDEMAMTYKLLDNNSQLFLQIIRTLDEYGLSNCSIDLVRAIFDKLEPAADFKVALSFVRGHGFLKRAEEEIEVYRPYLDVVTGWRTSEMADAVAAAILTRDRRSQFHRIARVLSEGDREQRKTGRKLVMRYLEAYPNDGAAHHRLGYIAGRDKNWPEAKKYYERAIELGGQHPSTHKQLAFVYHNLGHEDKALEQRAAANAINAKRPPTTLVLQAVADLTNRNYHSALATIDQAIASDRHAPKAYGLKGQILLRMRQDALAETALKEAEKRNPDGFVYFGLAQVERRRKNWDEAIGYLTKAIEFDPYLGQAHSLLGQCLHNTGKQAEAIKSFEKAVAYGVGAPANYGLGLVYRSQRKWPEMLEKFRAVVRDEPGNAAAWSYLGDALANCGMDEALQAHEVAIELEPDRSSHKNALANALGTLGRYEDAVRQFEQYLKGYKEDTLEYKSATASLEHWRYQISKNRDVE